MSTPGCINLRDRFGHSYKIEYDPAYYAQYGTRSRRDDPWLQVIPGRRGHIYPHGGNLLAVSTSSRGPVANAIRDLPGVQVVQDGSDGINATFPPELIDQVARLIQARRRRRLSPAHRARAVGNLVRKPRQIDGFAGLESTISAGVDI